MTNFAPPPSHAVRRYQKTSAEGHVRITAIVSPNACKVHSLLFHSQNRATIANNVATSFRLLDKSDSSLYGISLQLLVNNDLKLPDDLPLPSFSFSENGKEMLIFLRNRLKMPEFWLSYFGYPPCSTRALLCFAEAHVTPLPLPSVPPFMLVMFGLAARTLPFVISVDRPGEDQPPPRRGDGERERDMRPEE